MPIVQSGIGGLTPQADQEIELNVDQDFGYLFDTEMKASNVFGRLQGYGSSLGASDNMPDPDFDPITDEFIEGRMEYLSEIGQARNRQEAERIVSRIDMEREQNSALEGSGVEGVLAALGAGVLDPINLIPMVGEAKIAYSLARTAKITKLAFSGAKTGLMVGAGQEAIAQQTRITRSAEESLVNITAMTMLGAATGGAIGLFGKQAPKIADDIAQEAREYADIRSVGAAQSRNTTFEQETLASAANLEKFFRGQDPILRLTQGQSLEARRIVQELADVPMMFEKNKEGIASPVPIYTQMKMFEGKLDRLNASIFDVYMDYRVGRAAKFGEAPIVGLKDMAMGAPAGKLTFPQFREEIGKAMSRADKHEIPQIAQAAKMYREELFNVHRDEAVRLGKLPVGVEPDTAISYVSRLYNKPKIKAMRQDFEARLVSGFRTLSKDLTTKLENAQKQNKIAVETADKYRPQRDEMRKEAASYAEKTEKNRKRRKELERDVKIYGAESKKKQTKLKNARQRVADLTPAQASKDFSRAIRDLKKGVPQSRQPVTLSQWVKAMGGIQDYKGEIAALGDRKLVNNKSGMHLDDIARAAWERGFFPEAEERIDINEFLQALSDDLSGMFPRVDEADLEKVFYAQYLSSLNEELAKAGIDINKLAPEEIEGLLSVGKKGVKDAPQNRARLREADYALRQIEREAEELAEKLAMRQKSLDEVLANEGAFRSASAEIRAMLDDVENIIKNNEEKAARWDDEAKDITYLAGASEEDFRVLASDITDGLLNLSPQEYAFGVPVARGALKKRTIPIPDAVLEDFLERDIFEIARRYNHTMASDLLLTEKFGRADMEPAIFKVKEEFRAMRSQMEAEGKATPEALTAIAKEEKNTIRDLEALRDKVRGTYALPQDVDSLLSRSFQVAKGVNYMRLMGGMQLSAATDVGRIFAADKLSKIFGETFAPMIKDFKQFRLSAEEVKLAGTALDMVNNDRTLALAGLDDVWHGRSKFERGLQAMQDNYKFVSLMAPWNAAMKQIAGVIAQTRSLRWFERLAAGDNIPAEEITRLARYGIDTDMAGRIWQQIKQHGKKKSGIWWANTSAWADKEAVLRYRAAINREVDGVIVSPGLDRPLWMSTELGSVVGQFKSFGMAATQRMLISGMQERNMNQLNGMLISVVLGMGVFAAKAKQEEIDNANAAKWIFEGVDRSGITAWLMDAHNILESVTGYGINAAMGQQQAQRYASRGAVSAVLGPTFGLVAEEIIPTVGSISRGEADKYTIHNMRQMMPYQNLYYLKSLFDAFESGAASAIGVEPLQ
jgi:hypothetical protein